MSYSKFILILEVAIVPKIEIDDEVFAYLQKNATPLVDSSNDVLRRLLLARPTPVDDAELNELLADSMRGLRKRASKADLGALIKGGYLQVGESLYLVDYQGKRVDQYEAAVTSQGLRFAAAQHTMSGLAKELLQKHGFRSDAVRGPSHWVTAKNVSVTMLWQQMNDHK